MLDVDDVRQDLSEHFGVVGNRIVGTFRSQPSYMQYSEADSLITPSQQPAQIVSVSRVKDRNYGTYPNKASETKLKSQAIGNDNKKYRIANIEDNDPSTNGPGSSSKSTASPMTQSTASTSSFGINVRGIDPNDPINYRNPDV